MRRGEYLLIIDKLIQNTGCDRAAKRYQRTFQPPLQTGAGVCSERVGWLLRERCGDQTFFGEVAPFPGFVTDPGDWEHRVERWLNGEDVRVFGDKGALGFGGWSLGQELPFTVRAHSAGLIQGDASRQAAELTESGVSVVKVKIGIGSVAEEQERVDRMISESGGSLRFRLDANQSLNLGETKDWINWIQKRPSIEFIEQPLPIGEEGRLVGAFGEDASRIALDESVVSRMNLERVMEGDWSGWFVVKPSLFGAPDFLFGLPEGVRKRIILSSAFESGIGFSFVLKVASELGDFGNVHGFGTRGRFGEDGMDGWSAQSCFEGEVNVERLEEVFSRDA